MNIIRSVWVFLSCLLRRRCFRLTEKFRLQTLDDTIRRHNIVYERRNSAFTWQQKKYEIVNTSKIEVSLLIGDFEIILIRTDHTRPLTHV